MEKKLQDYLSGKTNSIGISSNDVAEMRKKKRKRKSPKGISMKVEGISIIKTSDKPGVHIKSGTIGVINGVSASLSLSSKGAVTEIPIGRGCEGCKIVITNTGVMKQSK